jgi:hypothetical protein
MIDTRNYAASDTLKEGTMVIVRAFRAADRKALLAGIEVDGDILIADETDI